jgi:hypothetical protein
MKVVDKFMKVLKSNQALLFLLALILAGFAIHHTGALKNTLHSGFKNEDDDASATNTVSPTGMGSDLTNNSITEVNDSKMMPTTEDAQDLLPKNMGENNSDFNAAAGNFLNNENLVSTFQVPTQSQTLRNANLQLRSEPANPQTDVCAWNQTTIQPDLYRKPLE